MNLNLSGHHVDLTPALREYVHEKLKRVERHFDHLISAEIVLTVEKDRQKAEATEGDMYAAIDRLMDKLDRQTRRHKEKVRDHHQEEAHKRMTIQ